MRKSKQRSSIIADARALEELATGSDPNRRLFFGGWLAIALFGDFLLLYSQVHALERQRAGESYGREAILFGLAVAIYVFGGRRLYREACWAVATRIGARCREIVTRLLQLPLIRFDAIGRPAIMTRLTGDIHRVVTAGQPLVDTARVFLKLAINAIYVATLSQNAAILALAVAVAMCVMLLDQRRALAETNAAASRSEERMYGLVEGLVRGAGLVKLHAGRSKAITAVIYDLADGLRSLRSRVYSQFYAWKQAATVLVYAVLGVNVFLLPLLFPLEASTIREIDFVVVWLFFRVTSLAIFLPELSRSADALRRIEDLERKIDESGPEPQEPASSLGALDTIGVAGLTFRYSSTKGRDGYCVGPIDITFKRGEVVFVTGSNGSGKSTFLRMLTGLYACEAGEMLVDGQPLGRRSMDDWRSQFTTIFTDHHLFSRTYGVSAAELAAHGSRLLTDMHLTHKTGFDGDKITNRALSTGQRKRLALVLAQLNDRPVLVLDEWAAGQDPEFRVIFYHEILPRLRAAGKIVIAVTHDDQYFHLADRALHFSGGRVVEARPGGPAS